MVWLIVLIFVCGQINIFCMEVELLPQNYFVECKKISEKHTQELKKFIERVTDDNALEKINQIRDALQSHHDSIVKQKEIAFVAIKKKYNIKDSLWTSCLNISQELQTYREKNMWQAHKDVVHSKTMPQWFMSMLKKELVDVGFNPQQTDIYRDEKISMVTAPQINWFYDNNGKLVINGTGPGKISLNGNELDISDLDGEKGRCIFLAHMMKTPDIFDMLSVLRTFGVLINEKDERIVFRLAWQQALFTGALKKQGAHCVKSYYNRLNSSHCTVENYRRLSAIEVCWKIFKWLKKYSVNMQHGIPLLLKAKDSDAAVVHNLLDSGMVVTKKTVESVSDESPMKLLLQEAYGQQHCYVCKQHPEDMRDIPCNNEFLKDFICRQCYNNLDQNILNQKICPLCHGGCLPYDQIILGVL